MLGRGERFAYGAQPWIAKHCCSSLPLGSPPVTNRGGCVLP